MRMSILVLAFLAVFLAAGTTTGMAADAVQMAQISAGGGGGVSSDNGMTHVQIPPNARPLPFFLRFSPNTGSGFSVRPANAILLPNAFSLEFIYGDEKFFTLDAPGTATVKYNPSDLGGRSESTLKMLFLLEDRDSTWEELPTTVDMVSHVVMAQVWHAGSYAVSASDFAPMATPAPTAVPAPAPTAAPAPAPTAVPVPSGPPSFKLGFAALASLIPDVVGQPLESEHYAPNGDSLQQTTRGLMVWRKTDNWTAFTNGSITWINGPFGLQSRPNTARFDWEW